MPVIHLLGTRDDNVNINFARLADSVLPPHTADDVGKYPCVLPDGTIGWEDAGGGGGGGGGGDVLLSDVIRSPTVTAPGVTWVIPIQSIDQLQGPGIIASGGSPDSTGALYFGLTDAQGNDWTPAWGALQTGDTLVATAPSGGVLTYRVMNPAQMGSQYGQMAVQVVSATGTVPSDGDTTTLALRYPVPPALFGLTAQGIVSTLAGWGIQSMPWSPDGTSAEGGQVFIGNTDANDYTQLVYSSGTFQARMVATVPPTEDAPGQQKWQADPTAPPASGYMTYDPTTSTLSLSRFDAWGNDIGYCFPNAKYNNAIKVINPTDQTIVYAVWRLYADAVLANDVYTIAQAGLESDNTAALTQDTPVQFTVQYGGGQFSTYLFECDNQGRTYIGLASGQVKTECLTVGGGIRLLNAAIGDAEGTIQYKDGHFQGRNATGWVNLD